MYEILCALNMPQIDLITIKIIWTQQTWDIAVKPVVVAAVLPTAVAPMV
jgi:hypothetical protein